MVQSKYIVFPEAGRVDVQEEAVAEPGPGQILCRARKSLVSIGTELHCLRGVFEPGTNWADWVQYPFRPGYSMVGEVVAVGDGVTRVQVGDRVATYDVHQQYFLADVNDGETGVPEGVTPYVLPTHVSDEEGVWRSLAVTTQNAVRRAELVFGERVGVVGLGLLGQLTTQYLAAAGARQIIAIDTSASRLALAEQNGATDILQIDVNDAVAPVTELTAGWMLDAVFDVTGVPVTLAPCVQLVRQLGRVVLLGDTPTPGQQTLGPGVVSNAVSIRGIHGYTLPEKRTPFTPWTARAMSGVFFAYLQRGVMDVTSLITHRYSPLDAPQLYPELVVDRSETLGVILDWTTV